MKLNYKKTILVGFAFFLISLFWQAYDTLIPKILINKFGMNQTWSGLIMAADNVLALFLLPLFGTISDKTKTRMGKRTPFILIGTLCACFLFVGLSVVDNVRLSEVSTLSPKTETSAAAMQEMWDSAKDEKVISVNGKKVTLSSVMSEEEFMQINTFTDETKKEFTDEYTKYVVPARQHLAWQKTCQSPLTLIFFVAVLLMLLVSMATFRSPAVALMPDVTLPPLRSKGNAVINLMGTAGGALVLLLGILMGTGKATNSMMSYLPFICVCAGLMLIALCVFMLTVKEPKWTKEREEGEEAYGLTKHQTEEEKVEGKRSLTKGEKISLLLILTSVVFWFAGYNAVISKYSVYAEQVLSVDYNTTLMVATVAAIIAYLPIGFVASRFGRKKTILAGVIMLFTAFLLANFVKKGMSVMAMNGVFALAGVAWATINVNSYPMVVELARGSTVGKFTGYYYTASMAAQAATPLLSGLLMDVTGTMRVLFPYACFFVALAFVTMLFVKHGDSRPERKKGLEAFDE
ncbi:MAG: MFS transporter [Clostridia bacterium]|nr:MFS transporter [Clostridia bacterium]